MDILWQDLRHATRTLAKRPGFAAVIVLTLALGLGANTAVFSLVNAVLLAPLPFREGDRLVRLYDVRWRDGAQISRVSHSQRNFFAVREQAQSFESVAAQVYQTLALNLDEGPERVVSIGVSDGWLRTLGVQPVLGRGFSSEEEKSGRDSRAVLISHSLWQRRFGGDAGMVGRKLLLDGETHTVVGVMPPGFNYPYHTELWRIWTFDPTDGRSHFLNAQARLRQGVTLQQAQAELDTISARLAREFPETNESFGIWLRPTRDSLVDNNDRIVLLLFVAVGFVLLIACANVANLLLARSATRLREFAIRATLGASRSRQVRQLLTENILLSLLGGMLGVLCAVWVSEFLLVLVPPRLSSVLERVEISPAVLGFTLVVSLAVGISVGFTPALRMTRLDLNSWLKEGARSSGGARRYRLLNGLVVGEFALALVLVTGAGLLAQNLYRLQKAPLGFSLENLLTLQLALPESPYANPVPRINFVRQALERIQALPGIEGAGVTNIFPLTDGNQLAAFVLEGQPDDPDHQLPVNHRVVTPGYFAMMKIPLLRGRLFTEQDRADTQPVVVISQKMARRYWPDQDPVGKQVRMARQEPDSPPLTIVGVVGDIVQPRIGDDVEETWYLPHAQSLVTSTVWTALQLNLGVRTAADPGAIVRSVKNAIWQVDSTIPIYDVRTGQEFYSETLSPKRVSTLLVLVFSASGLLLAILGTYAVISYAVAQRTQEIGIRMALGAQPRAIQFLIVKQGALLVLLGLAIGLGATLALARLLSHVLTEISPTDPATLAGVAILLAGVALLACYLPARRATRVDPMTALRYE